jgi:hypothetical protein
VPSLAARWPGSVAVLGGDWNTRTGENPGHPCSLQSLYDDLRATNMVLRGIDGFITVGPGFLRQVEELDQRYGSDAHNPVTGKVKT